MSQYHHRDCSKTVEITSLILINLMDVRSEFTNNTIEKLHFGNRKKKKKKERKKKERKERKAILKVCCCSKVNDVGISFDDIIPGCFLWQH